MFSGKLGVMKQKWGHSSSLTGTATTRLTQSDVKTRSRAHAGHHSIIASQPLEWCHQRQPRSVSQLVCVCRAKVAPGVEVERKSVQKIWKGGISGCKHRAVNTSPFQQLAATPDWCRLSMQVPCPHVVVARYELFNWAFLPSWAYIFFFHPSTYPTPRVTAGIQPSCLKVKVAYTLNKPPVLPQRDKQPSTLTSKNNLELPLGLMCMSLYCGWKQEYLERSHSGTERSCQHTTQTHKYPRRGVFLCVP